MAIVRISKKEELRKYFDELSKNELINYSSSGYRRWYWQYMENPFCSDQSPPAWIYIFNNKIIGYLGAILVELKVGPRKLVAAWCVDLKSLPEYKVKGLIPPGKALVRESNRHLDVYLTIGQTDFAFRLLINMRWKFIGCIPYYIKVWDPRTFITGKVKNLFIANLISLPVSLFLNFFNYLKRPRKPKRIEVTRIDNFDAKEVDLFWEEISSHYKIAVSRNKSYLNWKYDKQPGMNYAKFRAVCDNKVYGYIVVRSIKVEFNKKIEGLITDVITRPNDKEVIHALIFAALEYLKSENCSLVRCLLNNKDIQRALIDSGFIKRKSQMRFLVKSNVEGLEEVYNLDNWYITAGDCDIDR